MAAIQPTDNTGLIVDEFISYATNHLNSVKGTIYTVSLYPPVGTPNVGVLNWIGYSITPATPTKVVTEDDFKPKEDVEPQFSVFEGDSETVIDGTTEEEIDAELAAFLAGPELIIQGSGIQVSADKFSKGKPFTQGFRGGSGRAFSSGGSTAVNVDLGNLDLSADWITLSAQYIGKKEGYTERATWDVNAYRCGFGSAKIIGSDGKIRAVQPSVSYYKQTGEKVPANGDTTTVQASLKLLQYEVANTYKDRLVGSGANKIPQETFDALNNKQKAALLSYVYNVGSLRIGIATAIKNKDFASATAQIKAGPISGGGVVYDGLIKRRAEEATMFST